jgi:hypothetical protein
MDDHRDPSDHELLILRARDARERAREIVASARELIAHADDVIRYIEIQRKQDVPPAFRRPIRFFVREQ